MSAKAASSQAQLQRRLCLLAECGKVRYDRDAVCAESGLCLASRFGPGDNPLPRLCADVQRTLSPPFDDTDPRLKKSALEYYDLIREDVRWLECQWDAEYTASDRYPSTMSMLRRF